MPDPEPSDSNDTGGMDCGDNAGTTGCDNACDTEPGNYGSDGGASV